MTHGIIFEPDPECRALLQRALASLKWSAAIAGSLAEAAAMAPGPWACLLAVESGDVEAVAAIRALRERAEATALCLLVDEHSPEFDALLRAAGADAVFVKPVAETEIIEALVAGFLARRP